MRSRFTGLAAAGLVLLAGCGTPGTAQAPVPTLKADVDPSLPPGARAKQRVLHDVLVNLQEGYPPEKLKALIPGVTFRETQSTFLEGASQLIGWGFAGHPQGDAVPVTLVFAGGGAGDGDRRTVDRVYLVTGSDGRFSVSRR